MHLGLSNSKKIHGLLYQYKLVDNKWNLIVIFFYYLDISVSN